MARAFGVELASRAVTGRKGTQFLGRSARYESHLDAIIERAEQGTLKFITGWNTEKVEDVLSDPHVSVTFQQGGAFLSVSGRALLKVQVEQAEYWDNRGLQGLKYVFQAVRSAVTGTEPKVTSDQHGQIRS